MNHILIRAGRPPHDSTPNEAAFAWRGGGHFASNAGNMLFSDSVYRALKTPDTQVHCDNYAPEWGQITDSEVSEINERYDAYVIPLANAFRPGFIKPLNNLTAFIEKLTIPTIVTGVGAQLGINDSVDTIPNSVREGTIQFVEAVLKHSPSLGVRGETTRQVLLSLGFHDSEITVIGCPSLYNKTRDFTISKEIKTFDENSKIAINLESSNNELGALYKANEAVYPNLVSIYQTVPGGNLILWGQTAENFPEGTPRTIYDKAYREGRLRFFTNPKPWREFLSTQDFAFGVRIHGTIAALTAGTPAFMLPIDSRTQELSEYHGIPRQTLKELMSSGKYLAQDIYDKADFTEFNTRMPENWDRYYKFLESCGLSHIQQAGNANLQYAEELENFTPAPAILPINMQDPAGLASRIRWLRQDRAADHLRAVGIYEPEFEFDKSEVKSAQKIVKELSTACNTLSKQVDGYKATNNVLEERIKALEEYKKYASLPFEKRLWNAIKYRSAIILRSLGSISGDKK